MDNSIYILGLDKEKIEKMKAYVKDLWIHLIRILETKHKERKNLK